MHIGLSIMFVLLMYGSVAIQEKARNKIISRVGSIIAFICILGAAYNFLPCIATFWFWIIAVSIVVVAVIVGLIVQSIMRTHAFLYSAGLEKKNSEDALPEYDSFMAKVKEIFGDNIPHDAYGNSFTDESILKSISSSLNTGIENLLENTDFYLQLMIQNKNEAIFCLTGATSLFIDPIFTAYALYLYHFNREISFDTILRRVRCYAKMFSSFHFKRTVMLVDFAKEHGNGRMKVAPFINKQTGEAFKSCAFVDSNDNVTLCAFGSIDFSSDDSQTPRYIANNKDHLVVVQTKYGTYKLLDNNRLKEERICCLSVMIQNIFFGDDGFHYKTEDPFASLYDVNELNPDGTMKKASNENTFAHVLSEAVNNIENMLCICGVLGLP